jgi:hypothetical protein
MDCIAFYDHRHLQLTLGYMSSMTYEKRQYAEPRKKPT